MIEYAPAFSSVIVFYDPLIVGNLPADNLQDKLSRSYQIVAALLREYLSKSDVPAKRSLRINQENILKFFNNYKF
ncbi:MAG: hypothetical protein ABFC84_01870 [Veillonellales bacterium]